MSGCWTHSEHKEEHASKFPKHFLLNKYCLLNKCLLSVLSRRGVYGLVSYILHMVGKWVFTWTWQARAILRNVIRGSKLLLVQSVVRTFLKLSKLPYRVVFSFTSVQSWSSYDSLHHSHVRHASGLHFMSFSLRCLDGSPCAHIRLGVTIIPVWLIKQLYTMWSSMHTNYACLKEEKCPIRVKSHMF